MAEESIMNHVESEKTEPEDGDQKANPERLTITKGPPKILSRYLSGSRGSCHDRCKYGIQDAVEDRPWSIAQKRVTTRGWKTKVQEENVTYLAGTKKLGSISRTSLTSKNGEPNSPVGIKEVKSEKTVTWETNSPHTFEGAVVSLEHDNSDLRHAGSEPSPQESSESPTKREIAKNQSHFGSSSRKEIESRRKQTRTSLAGGKERSMPASIPLSSKHNVKKSTSLSANKTAKNLTGVSSPKNHVNVEEVKPEESSNENIPDKILHVIEPTSANLSEEPTQASDETKLSSPSPSPSGDKSLKHTSNRTGKSGVSSSSRKSLRHAGHGTRPTSSVALSHLSSGSKSKKTKSISRSTSISSASSSKSSLGKQSDATSKSNKTRTGHQGESVKMGYKIRPKMTTVVGAANKVLPPRKMAFRRGKVIELQPQSNNIPRRLKFKPARLLGDGIKRDIDGTRKRIDTSKEVDEVEINAANIKSEKVVPKLQIVEGSKRRIVGKKVGVGKGKIDGSKQGSEKVVLRHQNVEGKRENPRLYNNVIEETATMLAELRKSKVKALVGAFETVISLDSPREATPAEVSTAC